MNEALLESLEDWLEKARADRKAVEILSAHADCPAEVVCFHCQQYAEKVLKAILTLHGIEAPRTHDLSVLAYLALPVRPEIGALVSRIGRLSPFAVHSRYPGALEVVAQHEMNEMISLADELGEVLLPILRREMEASEGD